MSTMSSSLETEDLENVALVRMEDVQPSRARIDRTVKPRTPSLDDEEIFETCIIDKVEYDDCTIGDDSDSNIGSMVSIKSEEVVNNDAEDSDNGEIIVPEVLDPPLAINMPVKIHQEKIEHQQTRSDSWPTLEILPGGVIKNALECETHPADCPTTTTNTKSGHGEMMYACAKCSQTFKYLFCLVKHVRWHEDQNKIKNDPLMKLSPLEKEMILIRRESNELEKEYKNKKVEVLARIATAIGRIQNAKEIFNK